MLIGRGTNVNSRNVYGDTALHMASKNGKNWQNSCFKTIFWLFNSFIPNSGHRDVAKMLIENYARVNEKNSLGNAPIHMAAKSGKKTL